jgi:hypothetical protein
MFISSILLAARWRASVSRRKEASPPILVAQKIALETMEREALVVANSQPFRL